MPPPRDGGRAGGLNLHQRGGCSTAHCQPQAWGAGWVWGGPVSDRQACGGDHHAVSVVVETRPRVSRLRPEKPQPAGPPNTQACAKEPLTPAWGSRHGGKAERSPVTGASDTSRPHPLQPSAHPLVPGPSNTLSQPTMVLPRPGQGASSPNHRSLFWDVFFLETGSQGVSLTPTRSRPSQGQAGGAWDPRELATSPCSCSRQCQSGEGMEEAGQPLEPHLNWAASPGTGVTSPLLVPSQ